MFCALFIKAGARKRFKVIYFRGDIYGGVE
ncbi:MAG: hypothetical protein Pg6A_10420 [Termitinemataceae bacterium]|nr:MAG: hypothetical protein Pg6A_10420 [Termitinemataceae bacterium]